MLRESLLGRCDMSKCGCPETPSSSAPLSSQNRNFHVEHLNLMVGAALTLVLLNCELLAYTAVRLSLAMHDVSGNYVSPCELVRIS